MTKRKQATSNAVHVFSAAEIAAVWCGVADIEATVKANLTSTVRANLTADGKKAKKDAAEFFHLQITVLEQFRTEQASEHGKDSQVYKSNNSKISKLKRVYLTAKRDPVHCYKVLTDANGIQAAIENMDKSSAKGAKKKAPAAPSVPEGAGLTVDMRDPQAVYTAMLEMAKVLADIGNAGQQQVAKLTLDAASAYAQSLKDAVPVKTVSGPQVKVMNEPERKAEAKPAKGKGKGKRKAQAAKPVPLSKAKDGTTLPLSEQVAALAARMTKAAAQQDNRKAA